MKVKIVSYSQEPFKVFNSEANMDMKDLIVHCARVSNPAGQANPQNNDKLLNYLIRNKHWSPLEMVSMCLEIETTRDIARQILRHRSFSFQEFSQRYADPTKELEFVIRDARMQDKTNRQNSLDTASLELQNDWLKAQKAVIDLAKSTYEWAISEGIAKEQARAVLPEGNTVSRMYMNGTLRSWIHYIDLRRENGTQQEHMDIAKACAEVISEVFPLDFLDEG